MYSVIIKKNKLKNATKIILFLLFSSDFMDAFAKTVLIVAPERIFYNRDFSDSISALSRDLNIGVNTRPIVKGGFNFSEILETAGHDDVVLIIDTPKEFSKIPANQLSDDMSRPSKEWFGTGVPLSLSGLPLGAGHTQIDWKGISEHGLSVSIPFGARPKVPVVFADFWQKNTSEAEELSSKIAEWIYTSEGGESLRAGVSLLPFDLPQDVTKFPQFLGAENIHVNFRAEDLGESDDGCGCESSFSYACDPDGTSLYGGQFVIESDNTIKLPGISEDDDDGCGCDSSQIHSLNRFDKSPLRTRLLQKADQGRYLTQLEKHLEDLDDGRSAFVLTCDPD